MFTPAIRPFCCGVDLPEFPKNAGKSGSHAAILRSKRGRKRGSIRDFSLAFSGHGNRKMRAKLMGW
jgi:hypothetical protein